jgi:tetratricopeptide (TPR) repeat protein
VLLVASCAPKVIPPLPEGEDYIAPVAGPEISEKEARDLDKAWQRVLTGDTERAIRDYEGILKRRPGLAAAQTGLAYARLRGGDAAAAQAGFEAVLERKPDDVSALVGAGSAAGRRGDSDRALRLYRRALAVAPDDPLVRKRAAALKLQVAERHIAAAMEAEAGGEQATAVSEYRAALEAAPELGTVRLSLAELLVARGDTGDAVALLESDPSRDRTVLLRLGEVLLGRGDYEEARDVYAELRAREPADEEAREGERRAQEALDFQAQPEEYRRIAAATRGTRADLAALLAVEVGPLGRLPPREPRVAVDLSGSWAREHIATVIGLGIMDVYPNHTFQPRATVRRADLARVVSRALARLGWRWTPGPSPSDMSPSHLDHRAVTRVVGAGLMSLGPDGRFEPRRAVTGGEMVEVVDGLATLVGP